MRNDSASISIRMFPCKRRNRMFNRDQISYTPIDLPDRMTLSDAEMLSEAKAFYDKMKRRHSVRDYCDRPVP